MTHAAAATIGARLRSLDIDPRVCELVDEIARLVRDIGQRLDVIEAARRRHALVRAFEEDSSRPEGPLH